MHTLIDEAGLWLGDTAMDAWLAILEDFVELGETIRAHDDETLSWSTDGYDLPLEPTKNLASFLFEHDPELVHLRDVRVRIIQLLGKARAWNAEVETAALDVCIEGGPPLLGPSLAHLCTHPHDNTPVGAIALRSACRPTDRPVEVATEVQGERRTAQVRFLDALPQRPTFVRAWMSENQPAPSVFHTFLARAFPALWWLEDAKQGLRSHSAHFFDDRFGTLMVHLSVLNDVCASVFSMHVEPVLRVAHLASLAVDASGESPNTRRNAAAAAERRRTWEREVREFWWHTKIRYDTGRIHFIHDTNLAEAHPRGRIVIGICTKHLTT